MTTYFQRQCEEHGLRLGREVTRISYTRDGQVASLAYLYTTGASFAEDALKNEPNFKVERVPWDGVEKVSFYAGD